MLLSYIDFTIPTFKKNGCWIIFSFQYANNMFCVTKEIKLILERILFMNKDKQKSQNERVTIDNDQLGENKDNNGGGKKDGCGCGKANK